MQKMILCLLDDSHPIGLDYRASFHASASADTCITSCKFFLRVHILPTGLLMFLAVGVYATFITVLCFQHTEKLEIVTAPSAKKRVGQLQQFPRSS